MTTNVLDATCRSSTEHFQKLIYAGILFKQESGNMSGINELEAFAWINDSNGVESALKKPLPRSTITNAIVAAATANSVAALDKILDSHGNANEDNLTAGLLSSAQCGNLLSVKSLLAHGARPNLANEEGVDSVMASLVSRHFDVTETLLKAGYNPCATTTKNGKTIKALANSVGATEISKSLPDCN